MMLNNKWQYAVWLKRNTFVFWVGKTEDETNENIRIRWFPTCILLMRRDFELFCSVSSSLRSSSVFIIWLNVKLIGACDYEGWCESLALYIRVLRRSRRIRLWVSQWVQYILPGNLGRHFVFSLSFTLHCELRKRSERWMIWERKRLSSYRLSWHHHKRLHQHIKKIQYLCLSLSQRA